jgi:hypothetical protein
MKEYFKYSFYTVLFLLGIFICVDFTLKLIYENTFEGQSGGKINNLLKNHKRVQILAVGDSRCAKHIKPSILGSNNYNLSHNGQSLIFHTGLLDQIIKNEQVEIDTILLNIDIDELSFSNKKKEFDINSLKYFYNKNTWIKEKINILSTKEKYKFWFPLYKWNGNVPSLVSNCFFKEHISIDGFTPTLASEMDSINVSWQMKKLNNHEGKKNYSVSKKCELYLKHINQICQENSIEFICYISPTFNQPKLLNSQIKELHTFFSANNIPLLDYSNEYYSNTELKFIWNWTDVFHLNSEGSKILTLKIRKDLNNLRPFFTIK